jgi:hypothetical protein
MISPVYTVDVAHPPRHPARAEEELRAAWDRVRTSPGLHILKVVHGYGSSGRGGSTRVLARNWAFTQRARFRAIINGEDYTLFDGTTQEMRRETGAYDDPDLAHGNPGILVIWVR